VHLGGRITVCAILMTSYRPVPRSRTTSTRMSMGSCAENGVCIYIFTYGTENGDCVVGMCTYACTG